MASVMRLCARDSAVVRFAPRQAIPDRILCEPCIAVLLVESLHEPSADDLADFKRLERNAKPARKTTPKKKAVAKKR